MCASAVCTMRLAFSGAMLPPNPHTNIIHDEVCMMKARAQLLITLLVIAWRLFVASGRSKQKRQFIPYLFFQELKFICSLIQSLDRQHRTCKNAFQLIASAIASSVAANQQNPTCQQLSNIRSRSTSAIGPRYQISDLLKPIIPTSTFPRIKPRSRPRTRTCGYEPSLRS